MTSITQTAAASAIAECEPFVAGPLTGGYVGLDYVVMSYGVTIASFDGARWAIDETKRGISATTNRHMGIVRRAVA